MKYVNTMRCFILVAIAILITPAFAKPPTQKPLNLPVMQGATQLKIISANGINSTQYDIEVQDDTEVSEFYSQYFTKLGWSSTHSATSSLMSDMVMANVFNHWSNFTLTETADGKPRGYYATEWKDSSGKTQISLSLKLLSYSHQKFQARIELRQNNTPPPEKFNLEQSQKMSELTGWLFDHPREYFKLYDLGYTAETAWQIDCTQTDALSQNDAGLKEYLEKMCAIMQLQSQ